MLTGYPDRGVGAWALIRNPRGAVLLVKPAYRRIWQLPGGAVEPDEYPSAACTRVVRDMTWLDVTAGRLLLVDYVPVGAGGTEDFAFVYDGGTIPRYGRIVLPRTRPGSGPHLTASVWAAPDDLGRFTDSARTGRIRAALDALADPGTAHAAVNGIPVQDRPPQPRSSGGRTGEPGR